MADDDRPTADAAGAGSESDGGPRDEIEHVDSGAAGAGGGRREVVVPPQLYKVVTVLSTLLSVVAVVAGFSVLNAAAVVLRNPPASPVVALVRAVLGLSMAGVEPYLSAIALAVGLLGLALIAAGGAVYAYGTRFRAEGMGKPKDEADEAGGDG